MVEMKKDRRAPGFDRKPILVCGGAGYIGSHMVRELLYSDYVPVIIDNLSTGHIESVPEGVEIIVASIQNRKDLDNLFKRYDFQAVIHLCANAYVGESVKNPRKYYHNNIINGLALLETMLDYNVLRIVFSSSCTVYGYPEKVPVKEDQRLNPISPYGHTKAIFEQILSDFGRAYGLRWVALRYFNASGSIDTAEIGEDHNPETHLIPLVLRQALKVEYPELFEGKERELRVFGNNYNTPDGTCIRDYIHVMDLARAHRYALEYLVGGRKSVSLNLAGERGVSVLDVIKACEEVIGRKIPYEIGHRRPGDPDQLIGDASKAKRLLEWEPLHSDIKKIVESAWKWHRSHPLGYSSKVMNQVVV